MLYEEDGADKVGHEAAALTREGAFDWIRKPSRIRVSLVLGSKAQLIQPTIFQKTLAENQGYSELLRPYVINLSFGFPFWFKWKSH